MYHKIEAWLNSVLEQKIPSKVKAFCFNLYEDENESWSIELVGTKTFDLDDEDWACDEITDFWTRYKPFSWKEEADWKEVLSDVSSVLKQYLENGLYADVLKSRAGVAVGFVDGNLEILYSNLSGVTKEGTMDKITMEENGEALDKDFVTVGTPHMPEAQDEVQASQNEMPKAEKSIADSRSKGFHSGSVIEICFIIAVVIIMILVMTFGKIISSRDTLGSEGKKQQTGQYSEESPAATEPTSEVVTEENGQVVSQSLEDTNADEGDAESVPEEPEQNSLEYSDDETVPEVYREVLKQYREMIHANITDLGSDSVQEKLKTGGEWEYVWDELYAAGAPDEICYSLRDLTDDGFPEMIMGIHYIQSDQSIAPNYAPYIVYYYSKKDGIEMVCPKTAWYTMVLYEEGIVELYGGYANAYRTYVQFQGDSESWLTMINLGVDNWEPNLYYKEEYNGESEPEHVIISEEEFFDIIEKYTAHPMQLEWVDLGV